MKLNKEQCSLLLAFCSRGEAEPDKFIELSSTSSKLSGGYILVCNPSGEGYSWSIVKGFNPNEESSFQLTSEERLELLLASSCGTIEDSSPLLQRLEGGNLPYIFAISNLEGGRLPEVPKEYTRGAKTVYQVPDASIAEELYKATIGAGLRESSL